MLQECPFIKSKVGKARKLSDVLLMITTDDGPRACYRVSDRVNSMTGMKC
jgi:hypothetical protein